MFCLLYSVMSQSHCLSFHPHGIHQLLFHHKRFDQPSMIDELSQWMYSDEFCLKSPSLVSDEPCPIDQNVVECPITIQEMVPLIQHEIISFLPKKEDTLFWCAYVLHHGEEAYQIIGNRYKNTEIEEKLKLVNYMRTYPIICKTAAPKISNVRLQETQAELLVNKKTSWNAFFVMCLFYQFHAIVVHDKTYMEFVPNTGSSCPTYRFDHSTDGHVSVHIEPMTDDEKENIRSTCIRLDYTMEKPLRAASHYKMEDLHQMAALLQIDLTTTMQKPKKADWYEAITKKCLW